MNYYQKLERPVVNESDAIQLRFGLTLQQIMNVVGILWLTLQQVMNVVGARVNSIADYECGRW